MCSEHFPIEVFVPGSPDDPRTQTAPEGLVVHYGPPLHPDDVAEVDGIPVTSVARTLVDLAECMSKDELRETFEIARQKGLLNIADVRASRGRVEWRPSLAMLDQVIAEFED
jgi:hypothetical protein